MTAGLLLLATMDAATSHLTTSLFLVVFRLGFGMVSQVLTLAIQNSIERSHIGVATGSANLFRALGGSIGVALFGALFAGGIDALAARRLPVETVADSLQTVFAVATPIAALALLVVLLLHEKPLQGKAGR